MRKRILFIVTKSELGGAQRFCHELIPRLDSEKYESIVAAGGEGEMLQIFWHNGFETIALKHLSNKFGFRNVAALFELWNLIRKVKPDILYLNSSMAGFLGSIAGFFTFQKPKIIYRIGGWAFKEPRNMLFKRAALWAEKVSAPLKNIIIVNSDFDRQLGLRHFIASSGKLLIIYNGIDTGALQFLPEKEAKNTIKEKIAIIPSPDFNVPLIGSIANFYKTKGLEFLILAAARIRNRGRKLNLVIIGDGKERQNLENLVIQHQLENSVFFIGFIKDAYKYLKAFDLFVLPSIKEGQPWTVLEAMAAKVPIVATNIAGIPEMIGNEKSGLLVEPADPDALAEAIEKALSHPSLAQELVENAYKTVKEKFDVKTMVKRNEELF